MIADKVDSGITTISKIGFGLVVGWIICSVVHQTRTTDHAAVVLPQVQAEAGCEHWRAKVATKLALQPTLVDPKAIPRDCAPPSALAPK